MDADREAHRTSPIRRNPRAAGARVALLYAGVAAAWIVFSDILLTRLNLSKATFELASSSKGLLFVLVTAGALYVSLTGYMSRLWASEDAVHERELRIRQAYVDVLRAVTGGRLMLMTEDEIAEVIGEVVLESQELEEPSQLSDARRNIRAAAAKVWPDLADSNNLISAAGEALNNALKHSGHGTYSVTATVDVVQVRVDDQGPGIDFGTLPNAVLMSGFSTAATMGLGFTLMLQMSDRLLLSTRPGRTIVVLEFVRPGAM